MSIRPQYTSRPVFSPQLAPIVIRTDGFAAGFAIGDRNGFRFVAAHPRFDILDGSNFRRLDDLKAAAKRLAAAVGA